MKTIIIFAFITFFASPSFAQDQIQSQSDQTVGLKGWYRQNSGVSTNITTLQFLDPNIGWAASESGLLGTTNGGANWSIINPLRIFSVYFADKNNAWAVADTSLVRSSNAGKDWQPVHSPFFGQMQVFGMDTLYLNNGIGGKFARSTNAGVTWNISMYGIFAQSTFFADSKFGFMGGNQSLWNGLPPPPKFTNGADFEITIDGGVTWIRKYCPLQENIDKIYAIDSNLLIANTDNNIKPSF